MLSFIDGDGRNEILLALHDEHRDIDLLSLRGEMECRPLLHEPVGRRVPDVILAFGTCADHRAGPLAVDEQRRVARLAYVLPAMRALAW